MSKGDSSSFQQSKPAV